MKKSSLLLIGIILILMFCFLSQSAFAENMHNEIAWELGDNGTLVISGSGAVESVVWEDCRQEIQAVIVDEGIESLPDGSFAGCTNLTQVTLPESVVWLGAECFRGCPIKEIAVPVGVSSIGDSCFADMTALEVINFLGDAPEMGEDVFAGLQAGIYYDPETAGWETLEKPDNDGKLLWIAEPYWRYLVPVTLQEQAWVMPNGLTVEWKALPGVTGYELYRANQNSDAFSLVATRYNTEYLNTSVPKNTNLDYKVRAFYMMHNGWTRYGDFGNVRTFRWFPDQSSITDIQFVAEGTQVEWLAIDGANRYNIYRAPVGAETFTLLEVSEGTSLMDPGAVATDDYGYMVVPSYDSGNGVSYTKTVAVRADFGSWEYSERTFEWLLTGEYTLTVSEMDTGEQMLNCVLGKGYTLTISGEGYAGVFGEQMPWGDYRNRIHTAIVEDGITHLSGSFFYNCDAMTKVILPESLTDLQGYVFANCSALHELTLPRQLQYFSSYAVDGCQNLVGIYVSDENPYFTSSDGVLFSKDTTTLIRCPQNKGGTYIVPSSVVKIEYEAFFECKLLTQVLLPEGLQEIGDCAFERSGIECITIPEGVTRLYMTFEGCQNLREVLLPESLQEICDTTFSGSAIETIRIPASVSSISSNAFSSCEALTAIEVAEGNPVFTSVDGVVYSVDMRKLLHCPTGRTGTLQIPNGVRILSAGATDWCERLGILIVPATVETVFSLPYNSSIVFEGSAPTFPENGCQAREYYYPAYDLTWTAEVMQRVDPYGYSSWIPTYNVAKVYLNAEAWSTEDGLQISWDTLNGVTGYEIYRKTADTTDFVLIGTATSSENTYRDTGISVGINAQYKVRAYYRSANNQVYYGEFSTARSFRYFLGDAAISETVYLDTGTWLEWNTSSGAGQYMVYRMSKRNPVYTLVGVSGCGAFLDYTTETAEDCAYLIIPAYDSGSGMSYGKTVPHLLDSGSWMYGQWQNPGSVGNAEISQKTRITEDGLQISWKPITAAGQVLVRKMPGEVKVVSLTGNAASFLDTELPPGETALYEIYSYTQTAKGESIFGTGNSSGIFRRIKTEGLAVIALPKSLKTVDNEAFLNSAAQYIILPDGCTTIGFCAFANCKGLELIEIPASVVSIAEDAFASDDKLTLIVEEGSYAEQWATQHQIPYICEVFAG